MKTVKPIALAGVTLLAAVTMTGCGGGQGGASASPAPTITVTAAAAPAPTVTVTATPTPFGKTDYQKIADKYFEGGDPKGKWAKTVCDLMDQPAFTPDTIVGNLSNGDKPKFTKEEAIILVHAGMQAYCPARIASSSDDWNQILRDAAD